MKIEAVIGRYHVRLASDDGDIRRAQHLRWQCFRAGHMAAGDGGLDRDRFDAVCDHVLIEDRDDGRLLGCFRVRDLIGREILRSYSACRYDLIALADFGAPMIEIGRFCIRPQEPGAHILRLAWGVLAQMVDRSGAGLLFGCASFPGADPLAHRDALAVLRDRHLAPPRWRPGIRAPEIYRFAETLRDWRLDAVRGQAGMPPLLRSYLQMGGWVSDHAVIDRALDTLHVFTGIEVRRIAPTRRELLRRIGFSRMDAGA